MNFLSSFEVHLLKVTYIVFSKYKRGNGAKKRERFLLRKWNFIFDPVFSSWVNDIKKVPIMNCFLEIQIA